MSKRIFLGLFGLLFIAVVQAGGWSVVTFEDWPDVVVVSEPANTRFAVRAHGQTLAGGLNMEAIAVHKETSREVRFGATEVETGIYEMTLTFPESGTWQWRMAGYGGRDHEMHNIEVINKGENPQVRVVTGAELFVTKGCVTCHDGRFTSINGSRLPKLTQPTDYRANPVFLRMWLADPQAVTSRATMPNLGLNDAEIDALVAYLSR